VQRQATAATENSSPKGSRTSASVARSEQPKSKEQRGKPRLGRSKERGRGRARGRAGEMHGVSSQEALAERMTRPKSNQGGIWLLRYDLLVKSIRSNIAY
jgi:hypothetical protein